MKAFIGRGASKMKDVPENKLREDIRILDKDGNLIRTEKRDNFRPNMRHGFKSPKGKGWH